jgi:hypothetical protein
MMGVVLALVALPHCSKKKAKTEKEKEREKVETPGPLVAAGKTAVTRLNMVARANLDRIRKTALWSRLTAWSEFQKATRHKIIVRIREKCRLGPFKDLSRGSFSIPFGLGKPEGQRRKRVLAAVLEGRFKSADLMKCVEELLAEEKLKFKKETLNGKPALRFTPPRGAKGSDGPDILVTALGENVIGAVTVDVKNELAGKASIFARAARTPAGRLLNKDSMFWVAWMDVPPLVARSFSKTPLLGRIALKAAAVNAEPSDRGFKVSIAFQVASDDQARTAAKRATAMKDTLEQIKHKAPPNAAALYDMISKAHFEAKGPVLKIELNLTEDQAIKMLITPFQGYLRKARAAKAAGTP